MRLRGSLVLLIGVAVVACERPRAARRSAPIPQEALAGAVHVAQPPAALVGVFQALDSALSIDQRSLLRRTLPDASLRYHFELGMWIRNEFGLWRGSALRDSLQALGVEHPDAMSDVVLKAYGLYLRQEPIDLRALAAAARAESVRAPAP